MDVEKLLHNLQEHVSCPVCQDVFKDPRHLPCLYSFCLTCLTNWHRASGAQNTLRCPKCQGVNRVPASGDLKDLPISFFVNGLIDALKIKECNKTQVMCGNCHKKSSEALYCFQCGIFFCEQCITAHNLVQIYSKDHRVRAVKDFQGNDYKELLQRPVFCSKEGHEKEELKFFCKNCEETVCQTCVILDHSGHKVKLTKEEAEAQMIDIAPLVQRQNDNLKEKMNIVTQLDEDCAQIVEKSEKMEQVIERFAQNLIETFRQTIQAKKGVILSELKNETKISLETVTTKRTVVQEEIKAIESALEKADKLLTRSTSVEVVQLGKALKKTLEEIDHSEPVARDPGVGLFDLVFVENHRVLDTVDSEEIGLLMDCRHQTKASESVAEGTGLNDGTVRREGQFRLTTRNSLGKQCYNKLDNVAVEMRDERGETCVANFNVNDNKDGIYNVSYLPEVEGKFNLSVQVNREHARGSPFMIIIKPFNFKPVLCFGQRGSVDGMFEHPRGVAVNSKDEIAVTSNHKVQIFNSKGNFVRSFGRSGRNPGELNYPHGIAFDKAGNVLVADTHNHCIQVFSGEGKYISMFGGEGNLDRQLKHPWGVSLDSNGNIIVADSSNNFIKIFSPDGKFLKKIGGPGYLCFPVDCVEWCDDLIVSDNKDHCIKVFTKEGKYKYQFGKQGKGDGEFNWPTFLSVTKSGHAVVCDQSNHRVQVFQLPNGKFLGKFGTQGNILGKFYSPFSVAFLSNGQIVVADWWEHRIQIFE
ncbi:tripartite motif-containing protein 2-like [Montipora foliosa]|uniref:tripartite motif-containing protein 2-like n=1 Tax=Montipora foliosa TaxID=591990 RepID=UPI0035F207A1